MDNVDDGGSNSKECVARESKEVVQREEHVFGYAERCAGGEEGGYVVCGRCAVGAKDGEEPAEQVAVSNGIGKEPVAISRLLCPCEPG